MGKLRFTAFVLAAENVQFFTIVKKDFLTTECRKEQFITTPHTHTSSKSVYTLPSELPILFFRVFLYRCCLTCKSGR